MPSRYHTYVREKVSGAAVAKDRPGKAGVIRIKQSYTGCPLPGKQSHAFAAAKKGYREVNGYAAYRGLSESHGGAVIRDKASKEMSNFVGAIQMSQGAAQAASQLPKTPPSPLSPKLQGIYNDTMKR